MDPQFTETAMGPMHVRAPEIVGNRRALVLSRLGRGSKRLKDLITSIRVYIIMHPSTHTYIHTCTHILCCTMLCCFMLCCMLCYVMLSLSHVMSLGCWFHDECEATA